jgi:hypothetical protein
MKWITHIVGNSSITHENQSGSRIRDSGESRLRVSGRANFVGRRRILPKAVGVVNSSIFNGARVFRRVGVSKIVRAVGIEWKVGSKERRIEARLSVVEERLLLDGRDWDVLGSA